MIRKLLKNKPLAGIILGFLIGLVIEIIIIKIGKSGNLLVAAQYIKRTGLSLGAIDGALFGGLTGFLLKLARDKKNEFEN